MIEFLENLVERVSGYNSVLDPDEVRTLLELDERDCVDVIVYLVRNDKEVFNTENIPEKVDELELELTQERSLTGKLYYTLRILGIRNKILEENENYVKLIDLLRK